MPRCAGSRPVNLVHFDSGLVSVFVLVDGQGGVDTWRFYLVWRVRMWAGGGTSLLGVSGCTLVVV